MSVICPFTIIRDTREQVPWSFDGMPGKGENVVTIPLEFATLKAGDYSIKGYEDRVAIERKSLEDLYGTLGGGRDRFEREMVMLNKMEFAAVVAEAGWLEICAPQDCVPQWRSRLSPRSAFGTILAWQQTRPVKVDKPRTCFPNVHWVTAGSRRMAEVIAFYMLERFWVDRNE